MTAAAAACDEALLQSAQAARAAPNFAIVFANGHMASSHTVSCSSAPQDLVHKDDRNNPATCPVMTRFCASPCMGQVLHGHASTLRTLTRQAIGKDCLRRWELEEVDVAELHESLQVDADKYEVMGSMSEDGDNEE
jgi:hypothetical protein